MVNPQAATAEDAKQAAGGENIEKGNLKVKKDQVNKAVRALKEVITKRSANTNQLFGETTESMQVIFNLSHVPEKAKMRPVLIPLPHPMYGEHSEVCLIVKDPHQKIKEALKENPIPGVTKVIGVDKLRRNYKTHEAKKALADSFDLFLCDSRVIEMIHAALGQIFYDQKKKAPIPVKIRPNVMEANIKGAMQGTALRRPAGPSVAVKIGFAAMKEEQLIANAIAVIKGVKANLLDNPIRSIFIQANQCPALPVWRRAPPAGPAVNMKKFRDDQSSTASDTGVSSMSETEGSTAFQSLPSDAGETLSTRDTTSEPGTPISLPSEEVDSEVGDVDLGAPVEKVEMPLVKGLKKKGKRKSALAAAANATAPKVDMPPPVAAPAKKKSKAL